MFKQLSTLWQFILPQHLLSKLAGLLCESTLPWLKDLLINQFIRHYKIDLQTAIIENSRDYRSFNLFFTRQLKPALRPIAAGVQDIVSPVDGSVAQIGQINKTQLLQAKNFYFSLDKLCGNDADCLQFDNGAFATFYLAPYNYHRVHMPVKGHLKKTIYVPGKLFSVNHATSMAIPHLYSRNERLISLFTTDIGDVAVILVGAMLVGSIQTVWMKQPIRKRQIEVQDVESNSVTLEKGAELGYFKLGSTVIILCEKNKVQWAPSCQSGSTVQFGQSIGTTTSNFR
jgi:phosphatidylserine decarboxylase